MMRIEESIQPCRLSKALSAFTILLVRHGGGVS
jgi:hypothetical protein